MLYRKFNIEKVLQKMQ